MLLVRTGVYCLGWGNQQVRWVGCSQRYTFYMINVEARKTRGIWNYGIDVTMPYQITKKEKQNRILAPALKQPPSLAPFEISASVAREKQDQLGVAPNARSTFQLSRSPTRTTPSKMSPASTTKSSDCTVKISPRTRTPSRRSAPTLVYGRHRRSSRTSMKTFLGSLVPCCAPRDENGWQGNPQVRMSLPVIW